MSDEREYYTDKNGRDVYATGKTVWDIEKKVCPKCNRLGIFQTYTGSICDAKTDAILESYQEVYCGYGCEGVDYKTLVPTLDKASLKREIMANRARFRDDSLEVFNKSDNPYLEGYNCLYIEYKPLSLDRGWWVHYHYYLEYAHNGRNANVEKREAIMQKHKPTSKEAKELLYAWMVERFEAMTSK